MLRISLTFLAGALLGGAIAYTAKSENAQNTASHKQGQAPSARALSASPTSRPHHSHTRKQIHSQNASHSIHSDLIESLGEIKDWEDEDLNHLQLARIKVQIGQMNTEEIIQFMHHLETIEENDNRFTNVVEDTRTTALLRWFELDAPDALAALAEKRFPFFTADSEDEETITSGIGLWTRKNPEVARKWFEQKIELLERSEGDGENLSGIEDFGEAEEIAKAFIRNYERMYPGQSQELAQAVQSEEAKEAILEISADVRVTQENQVDSLRAFTTEGDDILEHKALLKLAQIDMKFTTDWISKEPGSEARDEIINELADTMLSVDFQRGLTWFMEQNLHDQESRKNRASTIYHRYATQNPAAAKAWLETQPNDASRDDAEYAIAMRSLTAGDYDASAKWIADISDPELREEAFHDAINPGKGINRNSIDAILNNPNRIPGIPSNGLQISDFITLPSLHNKEKFLEAAQRAGLVAVEKTDDEAQN